MDSVCCQPVIESTALTTCCVLVALEDVLSNKADEKSDWRAPNLNWCGILLCKFQVLIEFLEEKGIGSRCLLILNEVYEWVAFKFRFDFEESRNEPVSNTFIKIIIFLFVSLQKEYRRSINKTKFMFKVIFCFRRYILFMSKYQHFIVSVSVLI